MAVFQEKPVTLLPADIQTDHSRVAFLWRNKWILKQSNYVVTYITYSWGDAAHCRKVRVTKEDGNQLGVNDPTDYFQVLFPDFSIVT